MKSHEPRVGFKPSYRRLRNKGQYGEASFTVLYESQAVG